MLHGWLRTPSSPPPPCEAALQASADGSERHTRWSCHPPPLSSSVSLCPPPPVFRCAHCLLIASPLPAVSPASVSGRISDTEVQRGFLSGRCAGLGAPPWGWICTAIMQRGCLDLEKKEDLSSKSSVVVPDFQFLLLCWISLKDSVIR